LSHALVRTEVPANIYQGPLRYRIVSYKSRRGIKKVKHQKVQISEYLDWYSNVQGMWERSSVLSYA